MTIGSLVVVFIICVVTFGFVMCPYSVLLLLLLISDSNQNASVFMFSFFVFCFYDFTFHCFALYVVLLSSVGFICSHIICFSCHWCR